MFGKLVEQELLGQVKREQIVFDQLHDMEMQYMGYEPAVRDVKSRQRGDPYHPKRFFPKSLLESLRTSPELGIKSDEQLAYYTAVGSAFDQFHGVDAFFEYTRPNGKTVRVTIDVTINSNKDRYKADVVLAIPSEGLDPNDENYHTLIEQYAKEIESVLLTK